MINDSARAEQEHGVEELEDVVARLVDRKDYGSTCLRNPETKVDILISQCLLDCFRLS